MFVVFEIMKVQLAFELIKNFIARIDVVVLALVGAARDEGDEVGVLPDDAALAPITAILVDPFLQIKTFQMWQHKSSLHKRHYRIAPGRDSS